MDAEFRLLGPVGIDDGQSTVEAGSPKQLILLASLLLSPGQPVPVSSLFDRLWGEALPGAARDSLYAYVTRLRRILSKNFEEKHSRVRLSRAAGGYLLEIDPNRIDLHRFRRLVDEAREAQTAGDDDRAAGLLRHGLALWRGVPLAGLPGAWAERVREGLLRQQLAAMAQLGSIELDRGRHDAIVDDLTVWVAEHSLAEPLVGQLMLALYRGGRGAEALTVYERTRRHLAEALGNEPVAQLQELHRQILRQDPSLDAATQTAADPASSPSAEQHQQLQHPPQARRVVPAQLPADIPAFTGRAESLYRLDALLPRNDEQPSTVVVSAVSGSAGVGKTALAVHWAHRVADRFPDGQFYVNLRGFDPGGAAMNPSEALRGFLEALEIAPQRIPTDTQAQAALYRSLLARRRMLVLLDNARDADQVRPLLPGSPRCHVLVTSRSQLTGLVAAGAHPLVLDLFSAAEARQMLTVRLGSERIRLEQAAADDIVNRCARLPLALAVVAARAATHPGFPLAALADELGDIHNRLDTLTGDDTATDVRAAFSWSYQALSPRANQLFRLLGLHPGPDFTTAAAASLAGSARDEVRPLLAELIRAQLLKEHVPGRYTFHDLLRAYAFELASREDADDDRRAALRRMLDYYLHTANACAIRASPLNTRIVLIPLTPGVIVEDPAGDEQALAWFAAERPILLAAVQTAADHRFDTHAWQLAATLRTYLRRQSYWQDWVASFTIAAEAAERHDDRLGQAHAQHGLGVGYGSIGAFSTAHRHLERAAALFRELGDPELPNVLLGQGIVFGRQGRYHEARDRAEQALEAYRREADTRKHALALNNLGWYLAQMRDYEQALKHCGQALEMLERVDDEHGVARTLDSLGYVYRHLGDHRQAIDCLRRALKWRRSFGDRWDIAETLERLGDSHAAAEEPDQAREAWLEALRFLDEIGHHTADRVRAKLAEG